MHGTEWLPLDRFSQNFIYISQSILIWLKWTKITDTGHESLCVCVCGMISCCDDCFHNQDRLVLFEVQVASEETDQHWASSTIDCEHTCCMLGTSWGWGNGWALCCKHNQFETSGVDIQGISLVNLCTYIVSVMASYKCVAKIRRNLYSVCLNILHFSGKYPQMKHVGKVTDWLSHVCCTCGHILTCMLQCWAWKGDTW